MKTKIITIITILFFAGCAGDTITISKCKEYKNGICLNKNTKEVVKCVNPILINKTTYCDK